MEILFEQRFFESIFSPFINKYFLFLLVFFFNCFFWRSSGADFFQGILHADVDGFETRCVELTNIL